MAGILDHHLIINEDDLPGVKAFTREAVIAELRDELPQGPPKQRRLGEHADEDRPSTSPYVDFLLTGTRQGPDGEARVKDIKEDPNELDAYLQHAAPPRSTDPTVWWAENADRFPQVSLLAKKYLTIHATSVPAERIFPSSGNIVNKERSCLDSDNMDALVFLEDNLNK